MPSVETQALSWVLYWQCGSSHCSSLQHVIVSYLLYQRQNGSRRTLSNLSTFSQLQRSTVGTLTKIWFQSLDIQFPSAVFQLSCLFFKKQNEIPFNFEIIGDLQKSCKKNIHASSAHSPWMLTFYYVCFMSLSASLSMQIRIYIWLSSPFSRNWLWNTPPTIWKYTSIKLFIIAVFVTWKYLKQLKCPCVRKWSNKLGISTYSGELGSNEREWRKPLQLDGAWFPGCCKF